jgi:hypothetical protein
MPGREGLPAAATPVGVSSVLAIGPEQKAVPEVVVAPDVVVVPKVVEEMAMAPIRHLESKTVRGAYLRLRRYMN